MDEPESMKIIEICKVAPNISPSEFSLPLTFLDRIWLPMDPASRLFFYEFREQNPDSSEDNIITRLKNSLSHTLQHYLPLAGHLTWPQDSDNPIIIYQKGDGVSLTIVKTQTDFHSLSGNQFRSLEVLCSLLPDFPTSETISPVVTLQITLFPNIGFCIGYVAHHAVMDGKSVSMFLHSWAYNCKNEYNTVLPAELTPLLDRSFVGQQEELEKTYPKKLGNYNPQEKKALTIYDMTPVPDIMIGTFILTRQKIDALKKSVHTYFETKHKSKTITRVSTFVVSTAYVLVCLTKAKQITQDKTFIGINANIRARLDPPLPPNYFGNCVAWCGDWESTKELLSENGFIVAVEVVIKALSSLNEGLVYLAKKIQDMLKSVTKASAGFVIAGSPQFELYKADFGWGKPNKVDMISIDKGPAFYLSDDRDGNSGIEIGVALKKHEAEYQKGDGVSLTIVKTQADFHFLSGNEFRSSEVLRSLLPDFPTSETISPVVTLQITLFPNIGFCIGYVAHHAVMDGKSVSMFLHSWACNCKNEDNTVLPMELTPLFDRSFVVQHEKLERAYPKN